jgi:hypothetical protein
MVMLILTIIFILKIDNTFSNKYRLQLPLQLLKSNHGVCWDQTEFERTFFEYKNIDNETYFIVYYNNADCPTHTFLMYKLNDGYYWFENSWDIYKGIHKYNTIQALLSDVKDKFIKSIADKNINYSNLYLYKYQKVTNQLSCIDFYKHCEQGENIII